MPAGGQETDGNRATAKRDQVERQELLGHVFAHADEHNHAQQSGDAPLEPEESNQTRQGVV